MSAPVPSPCLSVVMPAFNDVPQVVAARVGRTLGLWDPAGMFERETFEGRRRVLSWVGLAWFWASLVPALLGLRSLRGSGRPDWPLVSQAVCVAVVTVTIYGVTRFRLQWDVAATVAFGAFVADCLPGPRGVRTRHTRSIMQNDA